MDHEAPPARGAYAGKEMRRSLISLTTTDRVALCWVKKGPPGFTRSSLRRHKQTKKGESAAPQPPASFDRER